MFVIIGRWIGGLLGYKPFFREYTTDWDFAVAKMKGNWWTRGNVQDSWEKRTSWERQVELSRGEKATNAEFEELVGDMTEKYRKMIAEGEQEGDRVNRDNGKVNGVNEYANGDVNGNANGHSNGSAVQEVKTKVNGFVNGDEPLRKRV
jgi:hypothetical protein